MEVFYFLAAVLLIRRLQRSTKTSFALYPKWRTILVVGIVIVIALYLVTSHYFEDGAEYLVGSAILSGLIFYANKEQDFLSQRAYLNANIPLAVIGFINGLVMLIFADFYDINEKYFIYGTIAGFVWLFGRWATSKKQAEELRISAERRAELEVLVQERTNEISKQKDELQEVVKELRATQAQLVQSEKMASLGELTAGIAHEIQNPLNFVNNFSDVSAELLEEMKQELSSGDVEEALVIAGDIKQNLEKINHHGKRADAIVKGMLEHSRTGSGTKEPTNINALADEYMRLSYHGLRSKDKFFNAELITAFDTNLPEVNIVQQDIGRVLLNLFNNAFYAVREKQKTAGEGYKPAVLASTFTPPSGGWGVSVKDNGNGIPDAIKEKIMQPFFTTKPTGDGTGLGLSLSYDIIVKGHGGSIKVNSTEGEGAEFIITLPFG